MLVTWLAILKRSASFFNTRLPHNPAAEEEGGGDERRAEFTRQCADLVSLLKQRGNPVSGCSCGSAPTW